MSAQNPSTVELAAALSQVAKEIEAMRYQQVQQRVHQWQETHSVAFQAIVMATATADATKTLAIWTNERKRPVILDTVHVGFRYIGARSDEDNVEIARIELKAGDKQPVSGFDFTASVKEPDITNFVPTGYGGVTLPYRLLIDRDATFEAKFRYKVAATSGKLQLLATCAITVSDA